MDLGLTKGVHDKMPLFVAIKVSLKVALKETPLIENAVMSVLRWYLLAVK